jgi:hypothetical protein
VLTVGIWQCGIGPGVRWCEFFFLRGRRRMLGVGEGGVVSCGCAGDEVDAVGDEAGVFVEADAVMPLGVGVGDVFGG